MMSRQIDEQQISKQQLAKRLKLISTKLTESTKSSDIKDVIQYILAQPQPYRFQLLNSISDTLKHLPSTTLRSAFSDLESSINKINKFETFLVIVKYLLEYDSKIYTFRLTDIFNELAKKHVFLQKEIMKMENDIENKCLKINQKLLDTINIGVQYLPKLYERISRSVDFVYLTNLLDWILVYEPKTRQDLKHLSNYCKFLTKECIESKYLGDLIDFKSAKKLLKMVIEKSNKDFKGAENMFYVLESIADPSVFSMVISQNSDFNEFAPNVYLKCFQTLAKSTIGPQTLRFMLAISVSLQSQSQFNILKLLYQQFIIPKIVKCYKFCLPQSQQIQRLVSFYVNGFMDKIEIKPNHLKYFIDNYQLMTKVQMHFWLQLLVNIIYQRPDLQQIMKPILKEITPCNDLKQIVHPQIYNTKKKDSWAFLGKDLVERKKYKLYKSQYAGIKNEDVNCYMISSMQALYMSGSLPQVLKRYEKYYFIKSFMRNQIKLHLLHCMNTVFGKLDYKSKYTQIDDLKEQGPIEFRDRAQQDCQHYLNQLFEGIQKQVLKISDKSIQAEFKQKVRNIFQITIKTEIICSKCKSKIKNADEKSYTLSIDYKEVLSEEWQTLLEDYTCDQCKWKGTHKMKSKIVKFPEILFVHIKRFHFDQKLGQVKKLQQATIVRKFKDFRLEGFICHIGSKVLCGHYTLYYKHPYDPLKWVLFDDKEVYQMKIDTEDECFENNLKSENTPYIAIYKRVKK